jgi:hypothetical protein
VTIRSKAYLERPQPFHEAWNWRESAMHLKRWDGLLKMRRSLLEQSSSKIQAGKTSMRGVDGVIHDRLWGTQFFTRIDISSNNMRRLRARSTRPHRSDDLWGKRDVNESQWFIWKTDRIVRSHGKREREREYYTMGERNRNNASRLSADFSFQRALESDERLHLLRSSREEGHLRYRKSLSVISMH